MANKMKFARLYRTCDRIADPILAENGRYNLTQIKVALKERLIKAAADGDPLVDFDMMAHDVVARWDDQKRAAAERDVEKSDSTFVYVPDLPCAFGDGTRVPLQNLSRTEFYAWDRLQDAALDVVLKKHGIRKEYINSRKRAWLPHHETLNDVETQVFGFVKSEPVDQPETEPV
ncbi:hypothetical protein ABID65_007709 [Bradyrhizobium sp. S3.9.2]|uniref:Uncharacterized protein n=1 Tax=Bradyrhizobium japonicum TaxID=375 RepID=A0A1Y2JXJ1_BRAJP|nr:hypothetical protein [Bradyrhizobium japonicum]OSJ36320.1 hypothetical protein BSZ19_04885 [Bradyrhizobium japonicum]